MYSLSANERQQETRMHQGDPHGDCHRSFPARHPFGGVHYSIKSMEETPGDGPEHQDRWKNRWKRWPSVAHPCLPELLDLLLAAPLFFARGSRFTLRCVADPVWEHYREPSPPCCTSQQWPAWSHVREGRRRPIPAGLHRPPI